MKDAEIEITFSVQYQKDNEPTWWSFDGRAFKNPVGRMHDETYDLSEAYAAATDLYDGKIHTDSRPKYQYNVTATRVMQQIYGGGTLLTFGQPVTTRKTDELDKETGSAPPQ